MRLITVIWMRCGRQNKWRWRDSNPLLLRAAKEAAGQSRSNYLAGRVGAGIRYANSLTRNSIVWRRSGSDFLLRGGWQKMSGHAVIALEGDGQLSTHKGHELVPSARRLINSLRDLGYDFAQAVADLVDNSIEAGASRVNIDVEFEGDDSWVRITDDGKGMSPEELREAMRYGAEREYHDDDLGKFGLGLKTASMSQCQRLSVATRWNRDRADITAYAWDLDHIEKTNRWEILPIERNGLGPAISEPLKHA